MLVTYKHYKPSIDDNAFVAENSTIIGRCFVSEGCSIWFNAVLRADVDEIRIGKYTNIQDGCVIHCDEGFRTTIGENVTVGHNAIIHGCTIGSNCMVGMGATIMSGAVLGNNVIVGANSLVTSGKIIPSGEMVMGSPAKIVRELTGEEIERIRFSAERYVKHSREYERKGYNNERGK
jgi:carbonic anhydrase/acetyltransferase-like protein (isoleucine patch superfamily)